MNIFYFVLCSIEYQGNVWVRRQIKVLFHQTTTASLPPPPRPVTSSLQIRKDFFSWVCIEEHRWERCNQIDWLVNFQPCYYLNCSQIPANINFIVTNMYCEDLQSFVTILKTDGFLCGAATSLGLPVLGSNRTKASDTKTRTLSLSSLPGGVGTNPGLRGREDRDRSSSWWRQVERERESRTAPVRNVGSLMARQLLVPSPVSKPQD